MPSRRQQRRSLAIAWMTMIAAAASLAGVAHSRDDIADLFEDARAKPGYVGNRRSNVPSDRKTLQNSLSSLPGPDIFEDSESFADTESNAPHPRFKRIADPMDSPRRKSRRMPPPPHVALGRGEEASACNDENLSKGRRRSARRMFRRFALEEANPADESEAEYASVYDDDVDLPGAFLNDELTKKKNQFEDVYPEVSQLPKSQQSPPDFLKRPVDDMVRKKRDRDEEEEADCLDEAHEEYYYEDEAPEVSRRVNNKRASHPGVEYVDGEQRMDKRNSDAISAVNANRRSVDKHAKENEEERAASLTTDRRDPLTSEKVVRSSVNERPQLKASNTVTKISAAKSSSNLVKRKSQRKPSKEKTRPKPKAKPKPKPKTKPKKPKPRKKPKSVTGAQSAKLISDCCEEDVEGANDADRYKRDKTLIVKAVPKGKNVNELQIYQKADDAKKKVASRVVEKLSSAKDLTALSIGEVKDLLGKLMVKIDSLHDLVSELKNGEGDAHIEDSNENIKPMRSNSPAGSRRRVPCRRRWGPWTRWGACSVSCGRGAQSRSRSCLAGCRHVSLESEERVCSHPECPAATKFLGIF